MALALHRASAEHFSRTSHPTRSQPRGHVLCLRVAPESFHCRLRKNDACAHQRRLQCCSGSDGPGGPSTNDGSTCDGEHLPCRAARVKNHCLKRNSGVSFIYSECTYTVSTSVASRISFKLDIGACPRGWKLQASMRLHLNVFCVYVYYDSLLYFRTRPTVYVCHSHSDDIIIGQRHPPPILHRLGIQTPLHPLTKAAGEITYSRSLCSVQHGEKNRLQCSYHIVLRVKHRDLQGQPASLNCPIQLKLRPKFRASKKHPR